MPQFRHRHLIDAHAAGYLELPAEVLAEHAALVRLREHSIAVPTNPDQVRHEAVERMLEAAHSDAALPERVDIETAETEERSYREAVQALREARDRQAAALDLLVLDRRDSLITDHVGPAYDAVMQQARKLAPALADADLSTAGVARADTKLRKAVVDMQELTERYRLVRRCWARLFELEPSTEFDQHVHAFGEVRNADTAWPDYAKVSVNARTGLMAPWNREDTQARLLWLASSTEAQTWAPTPAQHDRRIREVYRDQIANVERGQWARAAVGAWAG